MIYGDFSRNSFDAAKQFTRVLHQQGRVLLDADWNEQSDIFLELLRMFIRDLTGPFGGTFDKNAFEVEIDAGKLSVTPGRYYVDGMAVNHADPEWANGRTTVLVDERSPDGVITYTEMDVTDLNRPFIVYLDVWEQGVTAAEDDHIREIALEGIDGAMRSRLMWRIGLTPHVPDPLDWKSLPGQWADWIAEWQSPKRGMLAARARTTPAKDDEPCITPPDARYRGVENQLYRVEIHDPGTAKNATFKWSRDNGAIVFPVLELNGNTATVSGLRRDTRWGLTPEDRVELVDAANLALTGRGMMARVIAVEDDRVTLDAGGEALPEYTERAATTARPLLRRWDHRPAQDQMTLKVAEGETWIALEQGIQVQFAPAPKPPPVHQYRSGDYWLIPARTATGDVVWSLDGNDPALIAPHGVRHAYIPLAGFDGAKLASLRRILKTL